MEQHEINNSLMRAMEKALETLAFVEAISMNDESQPLPDEMKPQPRTNVFWTCVEIVRPIKAAVYVLLPPELAKSLTMDMFGFFDDSEVTEDLTNDAISELCNVLAGRIATELLGDNAEFELGLPKRGTAESDDEVNLPEGKVHRLDYAVEGHTLSVVFGSEDFQ